MVESQLVYQGLGPVKDEFGFDPFNSSVSGSIGVVVVESANFVVMADTTCTLFWCGSFLKWCFIISF